MSKPIDIIFSHSTRIRCILDMLSPINSDKSIYSLMVNYKQKHTRKTKYLKRKKVKADSEGVTKFKFNNCVTFMLEKDEMGNIYLSMIHPGSNQNRIGLNTFFKILGGDNTRIRNDGPLKTNNNVKIQVQINNTLTTSNNQSINPEQILSDLNRVLDTRNIMIVRHGYSTHNRGLLNKHTGINTHTNTDSSLTKKGVEEVKGVANDLREWFERRIEQFSYSTSNMYVSDLWRTSQTAMVFLNTLGWNNERITPIHLIVIPCNHEFNEGKLNDGYCFHNQVTHQTLTNKMFGRENIPESRPDFLEKRQFVSYKGSYFYIHKVGNKTDNEFDNLECDKTLFHYIKDAKIENIGDRWPYPSNGGPEYYSLSDATGYDFDSDKYIWDRFMHGGNKYKKRKKRKPTKRKIQQNGGKRKSKKSFQTKKRKVQRRKTTKRKIIKSLIGGKKVLKNYAIFVSKIKQNKYIKFTYDFNTSGGIAVSTMNRQNYQGIRPPSKSDQLFFYIVRYQKNKILEGNEHSSGNGVEGTDQLIDSNTYGTINDYINAHCLESGEINLNDIGLRITKKINGEKIIIEDIPIVLSSNSKLCSINIEIINVKDEYQNTQYLTFTECTTRKIKRWWNNNNVPIHKSFLYFGGYQNSFFNMIFRIVCLFKSVGINWSNIYKEPKQWLKDKNYNKDENRCYGKRDTSSDICEGSFGKVTIFKENTDKSRVSKTTKTTRTFGTIVALKEFKLNGRHSDYQKQMKEWKSQAKESIINYKIQTSKNGSLDSSKYISEIKKVLFNLPKKDFVPKMMHNCLSYSDSLYFPSILMEDSGKNLNNYYESLVNVCGYGSTGPPRSIVHDDLQNNIIFQNRNKFLHQIALGLQFMNANGFFHTDIKPENICVQSSTKNGEEIEYTIKIIDFGLTFEYSDDEAKIMRQRTGSLPWMYFLSNCKSTRLDLCDIWAYITIFVDLCIDLWPPNLQNINEDYLSSMEIRNGTLNHDWYKKGFLSKEEIEPNIKELYDIPRKLCEHLMRNPPPQLPATPSKSGETSEYKFLLTSGGLNKSPNSRLTVKANSLDGIKESIREKLKINTGQPIDILLVGTDGTNTIINDILDLPPKAKLLVQESQARPGFTQSMYGSEHPDNFLQKLSRSIINGANPTKSILYYNLEGNGLDASPQETCGNMWSSIVKPFE